MERRFAHNAVDDRRDDTAICPQQNHFQAGPWSVQSDSARMSSIDSPANSIHAHRLLKLLESPSVKAVSFDVFDTAIFRPFLVPKDLFEYLAPSVKSLGIKFDFPSVRVEAERELRSRHRSEWKDPQLSEIYDRIAEVTGMSRSELAQVMRLEEQAEVHLTYPNPIVQLLFDRVKELQKRIVFCSDTYLSAQVIANLLERCGYRDYDNLFVSSEVEATKKHGGMFGKLQNATGLSGNEVLHIGDNEVADIENAKKYGLSTYHLPSPRDALLENDALSRLWFDVKGLSQPMRSYTALFGNYMGTLQGDASFRESLFQDRPEAFGYCALGPLLISLCAWMRELAVSQSIDRIMFLSRDGYLPLKAWNILNMSDGHGPAAQYLYISRRAILPLDYEAGNFESSLFGVRFSSDYTVKMFCASRFPQAQTESLLRLCESNGIRGDVPVISVVEKLKRLFLDERETIRAIMRKSAESAQQYFKSNVPSDERIALFDVGRKGTFQHLLSDLLERRFTGFYMVTESPIYANVPSHEYHSFFGNVCRDVFADEPDTVLYEALLSDPGPSVTGWREDGSPTFDREAPGRTEEDLRRLEAIHQGALDFVRDVRATFGRHIFKYKISPRMANHVLWSFWSLPRERSIVDFLSHSDTMSVSSADSVGKRYQGKQFDALNSSAGTELAGDEFPNDGPVIAIYSPRLTSVKGGAERVAAKLACYLHARGYRVEMLTMGSRGNAAPPPVYPLPDGITITFVNPFVVRELRSVLEQRRVDALLVLASGFGVVGFIVATLGLRVPVMLSERAYPHDSRKAYWSGKTKYLYNLVYACANIVSIQLPSFRSCFPFLMRHKVTVLPNPVSGFKDLPSQSEREHSIICVARISLLQKRQDLLIEAFRELVTKYPDWKLELFGAERAEDGDKIRSLIEDWGLKNSVVLHGEVSDIAEHLKRASIFAFPSSYEGFPNALAEALSAGLPAVGFANCHGTNDLIEDGVNGILVSGNGEADLLAAAIATLIEDSELRERMGKAAVVSMRKYAPTVTLKAWRDQIERLLQCRKRWFSTAGPIFAPLGKLVFNTLVAIKTRFYPS